MVLLFLKKRQTNKRNPIKIKIKYTKKCTRNFKRYFKRGKSVLQVWLESVNRKTVKKLEAFYQA